MDLKEIFNNVNRLLEFAEKKNTYIFLFLTAIMTVVVPFTENLFGMGILIKIGTAILYTVYLIVLIITGWAFLPRTKPPKEILENGGKDRKLLKSDNVIFFENICKYSKDEYIKKLVEDNYEYEDTKKNNDLVEQIIINANITSIKFACFKKSCFLTLVAFFIFIVLYLIQIFLLLLSK